MRNTESATIYSAQQFDQTTRQSIKLSTLTLTTPLEPKTQIQVRSRRDQHHLDRGGRRTSARGQQRTIDGDERVAVSPKHPLSPGSAGIEPAASSHRCLFARNAGWILSDGPRYKD